MIEACVCLYVHIEAKGSMHRTHIRQGLHFGIVVWTLGAAWFAIGAKAGTMIVS